MGVFKDQLIDLARKLEDEETSFAAALEKARVILTAGKKNMCVVCGGQSEGTKVCVSCRCNPALSAQAIHDLENPVTCYQCYWHHAEAAFIARDRHCDHYVRYNNGFAPCSSFKEKDRK